MIKVNEEITLELISEKHAVGLFNALNNSREHLSAFLPWVGRMQHIDDFRSYASDCELLYEQGKEVSFVIIAEGILVGRIGLHHIDAQNNTASIGYWLTKSAQGKGIVLKSCIAMISFGFDKLNLHRIELKAAVNNYRSQAIPKQLKFVEEGILREAELVNNQYLDLILYAMLKHDWKEGRTEIIM
ncbi:GNAT family protein [Pedobacter nyackensis]|uniref:GNAT family N-acetyltransferase n=1 Tax=Pedobacter nyackensis TaxID=475255 RepID=UPI0029313EA1|nr:GNAT family protein [Pedobacter nyackensis]